MKGLFFGLLAAATLLATDASAATAGAFQFVAGEVRLTLAGGDQRPARKGTPISVGDTVSTARDAVAQIKMGDGGILVVQPNSRLTVAEYRYTGVEDGSEKVVYRLEEGGFRAITGAIGHTNKQNYLIETPIAHMGVRGTDHESYYFPSAGSINGTPVAAGVYNKVNVGAAYIRTRGGEVLIRPNQAGFVGSVDDAPRLLAEIPGFFNRAVPPRPAQINPDAQRTAHAPVVQTVSTEDGLNLSNPAANAGKAAGGLPSTSSAVAYIQTNGTNASTGMNSAIAPNGATLAQAGGDAAFGVNWGTWQGGSPTVDGKPASGGVHFATSTQLTTQAQLAALAPTVVTATYSYAGGPAPTNQAGAAGAVTALNVGVNFSNQTISNYHVEANAGGIGWTADGSGSFRQFNGAGIPLNGSCSGCGTPSNATGSANGAFVGSAAERMITSFGLKAGQQAISGAAQLSR
jgi:hypothetical protein